jgi:hypothetical protein
VDLDTVSIAGSTVAFTIGPSLWLQVFPASFMSVSVEAAARYAFFPITPNVEGEKEEEFGGQEIEIPMADSEPIEVDTVEYTREYSEDIDIDSALMGRLSLNVEVGRPGEMTAFLGAGWLTDLSAPLVRFKAAELGEFGLAGLTLRVGFRSLW